MLMEFPMSAWISHSKDTKGTTMSQVFHKTSDSILKVLKVEHEQTTRSGNEIPQIGRYDGHCWKTWLLVVGCTSRAHTQYKWRLAKRLGCDQLREHNGHNHAQRQNILIKA